MGLRRVGQDWTTSLSFFLFLYQLSYQGSQRTEQHSLCHMLSTASAFINIWYLLFSLSSYWDSFLALAILWFKIRNIYMILVPVSGRSSRNLWNFLSRAIKGVFYYVNGWLLESTQGWRWGGGRLLKEPNRWSEGWNSDPTHPWPNGQWFHHSSLCNEASIKTQKDRVPGWWIHGYCGKRGVQHVIDALATPYIPCPCISSIWLFQVVSFVRNQ